MWLKDGICYFYSFLLMTQREIIIVFPKVECCAWIRPKESRKDDKLLATFCHYFMGNTFESDKRKVLFS